MVIRKRFGQHFLEPAWVVKLMQSVAPEADQTFLEIGPGRGALTRPLVAHAANVVAFEIDRDLAAALRSEDIAKLTIVEGDFLDVTADGVRAALPVGHSASSPLRVVGNLPYNVAAPILFKLVDLYLDGLALRDATVMLQREVAARLVAEPGTGEYGVLAVLIRHAADITRRLSLPPGAFRPAPKVRSTVVGLRFHPPAPAVADERVFRAFVQAVFSRRRKTLSNALLGYSDTTPISAAAALHELAIDGGRRPETLTIAELGRLADVFASKSG